MIKAKIDIFDDETGKIYAKDKIIAPSKTDYDYDELSTGYLFGFHIRILNLDLNDVIKEEKLHKLKEQVIEELEWEGEK